MIKQKLDFNEINERALPYAEEIFDVIGLDGEMQGNEYVCINPSREEDSELGSFKFNIETGLWSDFAADDDAKGVGVISYTAYVKSCSVKQSAMMLQKWLNKRQSPVSVVENPPPVLNRKSKKAATENNGTIVVPVPADAPPIPRSFGNLNKPAVIYTYKDELGAVLCNVLRFETSDGKKFRPLTLWQDKNGKMEWMMQGLPEPRPLYGLDLLHQNPIATLFICEGEKAADAARILLPSYVVMTTMNGAKSLAKADLAPLKGKDVVVWPDNDEAGHQYASDVVAALHKMDRAAKVFVMKPLMYLPELTEDGSLKARSVPLPEGYDAADAVTEGWTADLFGKLPGDMFQAVEPPYEMKRIGNFLLKENGVYAVKTKDGEEHLTWIASLIEVVALTRNLHNKNWGLLLNFSDRDGHKHEWPMPKELLSSGGDTYRQALLDRGADIAGGNAKDSLTEYFMLASPEERALCVNSIGWHRGVFVLPDKSYGQSDERVILQTANARKVSPFAISGTLQDWQNNIGAKCVGNSRIILAVCVSLTGPLLDALKLENGGFHFRGQSSSGKTKTLSVAASIYGGKAMVRVWRATGNAIESLAREHNDTVLLLDELGQVESQEAGDIAYTLGNGQTKARANVNGDAKETSTWRLLFISTGEIGLADHVAAGGGSIKAGQEVRMLDIPSDANAGYGVFENIHGATSPAVFADSLQTLSETYYGSPADALLTKLTEPGGLERAAAYIRQQQNEFVRQYVPVNAHGQVTRAATRFGAVAGVGEYCISIGILPWDAGHAIGGVRQCYLAWLEARGDGSASEEIRAVAQVIEYLERNGESRFTLINVDGFEDNVGQRTINRTGFRKILDDGSTEFWVLTGMYKTEMCRGFDFKLVTRVLKDHGYLEVDGAGKTSILKKVPGMGLQRVYVIKIPMQSGDEVINIALTPVRGNSLVGVTAV